MHKKILNDFFILLYPVLLLFGVWRHQLIMDEAVRMYQMPFAQLASLIIIFFLLLGLFTYYFLVRNSEFHISVLIIGAAELLLLLFPRIFSGVSESLYIALLGKYTIFGTILTLYLVLIIKQRFKG